MPSYVWIGTPEQGKETAGIAIGEGRGESEHFWRYLDEMAHADALTGQVAGKLVQLINHDQIEPVTEVDE